MVGFWSVGNDGGDRVETVDKVLKLNAGLDRALVLIDFGVGGVGGEGGGVNGLLRRSAYKN